MAQTVFTLTHHRASNRLRQILITAGVALWSLASVTAFLPFLPHLLYRLSPDTPAVLAQTLATTVPQEVHQEVGPLDGPTNQLIIAKIGVNGEIHEGESGAEIIRQGIWRTPGWGTPQTPDRPIILAAHRWGYLDWTAQFRRANSFYKLPKLTEGDTIEIIWNQRHYIYQIYASASDTQITDYSADLILYTCQLWNSPLRIFKYARLVSI